MNMFLLGVMEMKDFMAKKSLAALMDHNSQGEGSLKRSLTRFHLIMLGIGAIIGAGIFVITGQAAALYAGPAIIFSFIFAGLACAFAGLCYAEFAAMIPIAGSAYTYSYVIFGELVAWLIGWNLIFEYLFGAATVSVGWSGYVVSFLHDLNIVLPPSITTAPLAYDSVNNVWQTSGAFINLPAVFIVTVLTALLIVGVRTSATVNNFIVLLKILVIFLFIGFGIQFIQPDNWKPFIPENTGTWGQFGWSGIMRAAGIVFFAYIGFDAVSTAAQEAKNPQKDMPWGILGSLVICTVIYMSMALVMTGIAHFSKLNDAAPVAVAINMAGDTLVWLRFPIKIGAIAGLSSVILVLILGQSRIFFAMSNDGLLPSAFRKVHKTFKTPYITTIATGVFAAILAGVFPIDLLGHLVSIGTLMAFSIVSGGILIMRYTHPDAVRPFKVPFFPLIPALGVITPILLMFTLPVDTWIRLAGWVIIGLLIYIFYGARNSVLSAGRNKK